MRGEVLVVGDVHADWPSLNQLLSQKKPRIVLQCGDFGWWPGLRVYDPAGIKAQGAEIYWCGGNHEQWPSLETFNEVAEMIPGVHFCPHGTTIGLPDGRIVLFYGGACSIDKDFRTPGFDWFPEEIPNTGHLKRATSHDKVDIIVSHTVPMEVSPEVDEWRSLKVDDPTRHDLSLLLNKYQPSSWYFGHWHVDMEAEYNGTKFYGLAYPKSGKRWWRWLE